MHCHYKHGSGGARDCDSDCRRHRRLPPGAFPRVCCAHSFYSTVSSLYEYCTCTCTDTLYLCALADTSHHGSFSKPHQTALSYTRNRRMHCTTTRQLICFAPVWHASCAYSAGAAGRWRRLVRRTRSSGTWRRAQSRCSRIRWIFIKLSACRAPTSPSIVRPILNRERGQ